MPHHENLTPREAADYLRVSERTLIRWRNARTGPPYTKVGHKVVYRDRDLDRWLDGQRREPLREVAAA